MITVDQDKLRVRFDRFDLDTYKLFLKTKQLPESVIDFDPEREAYTLSAPSRFASILGAQAPARSQSDCPTAGHLFDYQRFICEKAFDVKRYAIWADCGLGKTAMFLEWARKVIRRTDRPVLIFSPLAVIPQTVEECQRFYNDELAATWLRTGADLIGWLKNPTSFLGITNYEKMIPGIINELRWLGGIVGDESSILKTGGGVIKWNLIKSARGVEYKLSCTATPAPNDTMEYASQAAFLEKLRTEGEILWTYFQHDKRGNWQVKPHAQEAFFRFMSDWSIYLRSPARYGFKDNTQAIPEPVVHEHTIKAHPAQLEEMAKVAAANGEQLLAEKLGVTQRGKLNQIAKGFIYEGKPPKPRFIQAYKPDFVCELIRNERQAGRQTLVWTVFDAESTILRSKLTGLSCVAALDGSVKEDDRAEILDRFRKGDIQTLISKASMLGYGMNFQHCGAMIFSGWNDSYEAWYQAVRRAYRYGQTQRLQIHIPYVPELEGHIYENILRKKALFERDTAIQEENYLKAMKEELPHGS